MVPVGARLGRADLRLALLLQGLILLRPGNMLLPCVQNRHYKDFAAADPRVKTSKQASRHMLEEQCKQARRGTAQDPEDGMVRTSSWPNNTGGRPPWRDAGPCQDPARTAPETGRRGARSKQNAEGPAKTTDEHPQPTLWTGVRAGPTELT